MSTVNYNESFFNISRENCKKLYLLFVENKNLNYSKFIEAINTKMNKNYNEKMLKNYIYFIRQNMSVSKSEVMNDILNYTIAKEKNDFKKINTLEKKINVNDYVEYKKQTILVDKVNLEDIKMKQNIDHKISVAQIKEKMNNVIKENDDKKDTSKKSDALLLTSIKKNIREIDPEKYVDFLIVNNDISVTSIEELDQFLQVINYFITNIQYKIDTLKSYNISVDEDKIRNFYITNEETLTKAYTDSIIKLYNWKLNRLENLLDKYKILYNSIIEVKNTMHIKNPEKIASTDLCKIKEDEQFVYDYYKQLEKIKKQYENNVKKLNTIGQEGINKIEKVYMKKIIKENN